jgi:hypothetical protein
MVHFPVFFSLTLFHPFFQNAPVLAGRMHLRVIML